MSTQFISRVERIARTDFEGSDVGPGTYSDSRGIVASLPGFIPFNTSDRRAPIERSSIAPPPGSYDIEDYDILKSQGAATAFKSKSKRFTYLKGGEDEPGPGDYTLKPAIGITKKKKIIKPQSIFEVANIPLGNRVPSIPNKHQSFGYDYTHDGTLVLQASQTPGYSGFKHDAVGPGDYEPREKIKYKSSSCSNFAKAPERKLDLTISGKDAPGPGYYNTPTTFDVADDSFNPNASTDLVLQLKAARKRQSFMFESSTERKVFQEVISTKVAPGPGVYDIPSSLAAPIKPPEQQCFNSTVPRFSEGSKSMRVNTAPGTYMIPSEFDTQKVSIMKKKKMHSRSGWAQNISFDATEARFFTPFKNNNPPPGLYQPKGTLADTLPRTNERSGPFGSKDTRFKEPKGVEPRASSPQLLEPRDSPARPASPTRQLRPAHISTYASRAEGRVFRELERNVLYPAPTAYNTTPAWDNVRGVIPMAKKTTKSARSGSLLSVGPGPGDYMLPSTIGTVMPNRKNIMVSSVPRDPRNHSDAPGPGYYNTVPSSDSLLKPSFNVMLANGGY